MSTDLTEQHAVYLRDQAAITPEVAARAGIRSATTVDELPEWARSWGEQAVPAIVFPWRSPSGEVVEQVRPDTPVVWNDETHKYLWPRGAGAVLNTARAVDDEHDTVLIVEGTKQTWAVLAVAPENMAVYGIGGCRNWSADGIPLADMEVVEDKKVVVILDADADSNLDVYTAGVKIAKQCALEGATEVKFLRTNAGGSNGIDDVLASRKPEKRASSFMRMIAAATAKPADAKPAPKKREREPVAIAAPSGDRPRLYMDLDRRDVINQVTEALLERWNTVKLFDHGGVLSLLSVERRLGQEEVPVLMGLDKRTMTDLVQETAQTVRNGPEGQLVFVYPEAATLDAIFSRYRLFAPIDRVARVPFVRRDGSICQTPGYDETSRTFLALDPELGDIQVPDDPTADEVAMAVKLIREEWLHDFFTNMPDEASRTNTVGLALTPLIRGLVSVVPMSVVDGLQMGVGKNLLADIAVAIPATGAGVEPMNWDQQDDQENRKQITSAFKDGADVYVFDEAHRLHGASLARVITAATWKDRNLGHSQMLGFRNQVTWVALGNNVEVAGDIVRRVYRIALRPDVPDPQDRPASAFRIPDIRRWTTEHRADVLAALLTLVRAWFAAGQPAAARETSFGSFEEWERIVGGVLHHAGFENFLDNTASWRRESNYDRQHWTAHVHWLWDVFEDRPFSCAQVRDAMKNDRSGAAEPPPGLTDLTLPAKDYNRALGKAYGRFNGVFFDGVKLLKDGMLHNNVQGWRVHGPIGGEASDSNEFIGPDPISPDSSAPSGGVGGVGGEKYPQTHQEKVLVPALAPATHTFSARDSGDSLPPVPPTPPEGDKPHIEAANHVSNGHSDSDEPHNKAANPITNGHAGLEQLVRSDPGRSLRRDLAEHGGDTPPLFDDGQPEYERLRPEDYEIPATETGIPDGWVFFDLESADAQLVHSAGPEFIRIAGYQEGDTVRVTERAAELADKLLRAERVAGHNILGFDLAPFARHHGLDIHQLAADGRIIDTQLTEVLLNPPPGGTKPEAVPALYSLDRLGSEKFGVGKSVDLKKLVKKHGGQVMAKGKVGVSDFDKIPTDDADYVRYCAQDVDLTTRLARTQRVVSGSDRAAYVKREHRIAAIALQISMNGVKVDQDLLHERIAQVNARKAEMKARLIDQYGATFRTKSGGDARALTEPDKLAVERAFNDLGIQLPRSDSGKLPATGKPVMEQLIEQHAERPEVVELAQTVLTFNGSRTVYQTALDNLRPDGRVHPTINMFQASGRWSVTDPGMTVFGKRGGRYVEREIFIPDTGDVFISADLAQVDARAIAAWSQDENYLSMFDPDRMADDGLPIDLHKEVAFQMFGDRDRRDDAKAMSHGYNYGLGFNKLAAQHGEEKAGLFLDTMREQFPRLVEWKDEIRRECVDNAYELDNGWGRRLVVTRDREFTQAPALVGQSAARDIMMEGLLRLPRWVLPMLRVQVHDEIVLSVPEDRVDEIKKVVVDALSFPWRPFNGARGHTRSVDISADSGKHGATWGAVYAK